MEHPAFYTAAITDVGTKKQINQDRIFVRQYHTQIGRVVFAALCDGMGGLKYGELASASIVAAFADWADGLLPSLCSAPVSDHDIRVAWTRIIAEQNQAILQAGLQRGVSIGSTVSVLLLTEARYFVLNIGDSRVYEIGAATKQITTDHTVIEQEIQLGNLTPEQAETAPMRGVLTRCVGVAPVVYPDLYFGDTRRNAVYMLCSDGFRHHVSRDEMSYLRPERGEPMDVLQSRAEYLVELNKLRGETDNISIISIYVP